MERQLIISYDISNDKLRTGVHKFLRQYGVNSQKSVFEMIVDDVEYRKILDFLDGCLPHDENDSARIYHLCKPCARHISRLGDGLDLNVLAFEII